LHCIIALHCRISPRVRVRVSVSIVYRITTGAIPGYGQTLLTMFVGFW